MRQILSRLLTAIRERLHLPSIERDLADIKATLGDQELRGAAGQALLANQQKQLEALVDDLRHEIRLLRTTLDTHGCSTKPEHDDHDAPL